MPLRGGEARFSGSAAATQAGEHSGSATITVCYNLSNMVNTPANVNRKMQVDRFVEALRRADTHLSSNAERTLIHVRKQ